MTDDEPPASASDAGTVVSSGATEFRKRIITSLIAATVFLLLFEPIVRAGRSFVVSLAWALYLGMWDSVYSSASLGHRNDLDVMLFLIASAVFAIIVAADLVRERVTRSIVRSLNSNREGVVRLHRRLHVVQSVVGISSLVLILMFNFSMFADLQLNTSFNQRITVLAARTTDQEIRELRAEWAQMKGRADYERIQARMDALAAQHGIKLPDPLLR